MCVGPRRTSRGCHRTDSPVRGSANPTWKHLGSRCSEGESTNAEMGGSSVTGFWDADEQPQEPQNSTSPMAPALTRHASGGSLGPIEPCEPGLALSPCHPTPVPGSDLRAQLHWRCRTDHSVPFLPVCGLIWVGLCGWRQAPAQDGEGGSAGTLRTIPWSRAGLGVGDRLWQGRPAEALAQCASPVRGRGVGLAAPEGWAFLFSPAFRVLYARA